MHILYYQNISFYFEEESFLHSSWKSLYSEGLSLSSSLICLQLLSNVIVFNQRLAYVSHIDHDGLLLIQCD